MTRVQRRPNGHVIAFAIVIGICWALGAAVIGAVAG